MRARLVITGAFTAALVAGTFGLAAAAQAGQSGLRTPSQQPDVAGLVFETPSQQPDVAGRVLGSAAEPPDFKCPPGGREVSGVVQAYLGEPEHLLGEPEHLLGEPEHLLGEPEHLRPVTSPAKAAGVQVIGQTNAALENFAVVVVNDRC